MMPRSNASLRSRTAHDLVLTEDLDDVRQAFSLNSVLSAGFAAEKMPDLIADTREVTLNRQLTHSRHPPSSSALFSRSPRTHPDRG